MYIENKDGDIDRCAGASVGLVFPNGRSVYHRGRTLKRAKVEYSGKLL